MSIAKFIKTCFVLQIFIILSGCAITQQLFPPTVEELGDRDKLSNQEQQALMDGYTWVDEYLMKINGLNAEGLLKEQETNRQAFAAEKTERNRAKLFLSLIAMPQPEYHKDLLSLIGDEVIEGEEQELVIQFLLKSYAVSIEQYNNLQVENKQLVAKRKRLETLNSKAEAQLKAARLEKTTLENQLKELKSIEASLIRRDMREGTVSP